MTDVSAGQLLREVMSGIKAHRRMGHPGRLQGPGVCFRWFSIRRPWCNRLAELGPLQAQRLSICGPQVGSQVPPLDPVLRVWAEVARKAQAITRSGLEKRHVGLRIRNPRQASKPGLLRGF